MKSKIPVWVSAILLSFSMFSSHAKVVEDPEKPGFVKNSYIISFKSPGRSEQPMVLPPKSQAERGKVNFGKHSSGQSKEALVKKLQMKGEIIAFLENANAIHVSMSAEEAERLRHDSRIANIQQGLLVTSAGSADENGESTGPDRWALDRMDNDGPYLNKKYKPSTNIGTGRTVWVLDTGIAYDKPKVRDAFKEGSNPSRLFIYDMTDSYVDPLPPHPSDPTIPANSADNYLQLKETGDPGFGLPTTRGSNIAAPDHGTKVAVAIGGKKDGVSYGIATGARINSVKIAISAPSNGNTIDPEFSANLDPSFSAFSDTNTETVAFHWLATYGNKGDIVNWSRGVFDYACGFSGPTTGGNTIDTNLENAMIAAHNSGIIIVVAAHNDGCVDEYLDEYGMPDPGHTPTRLGRLDGVLVVGGTSIKGIESSAETNPGWDELFEIDTYRSRRGVDISVFAPALNVKTLNMSGDEVGARGTSLATALMSGMIASGCSYLESIEPGVYCDVIPPQLKTKLNAQGESEPDFSYYEGPHPLYKKIRELGTQDTVRYKGQPVMGYQSVIDTTRQTSRFLYKSSAVW